MKTIIAPTDFSVISLNAVNYAADLAVSLKAQLFIFHVIPLPVATEVPLPAQTMQQKMNEADEQLKRIKEKLDKRSGNSIHIGFEMEVGAILPTLKTFCARMKPDMVVMSTQGAGAAQRFFFGSNTLQTMKQLEWPLLVVPAVAKFNSIKKIGLACDFANVLSTFPLDEIRGVIKLFNASLEVVHINTEGENEYGVELVEQATLLQDMLKEFNPSYHFLNNIAVSEGIREFSVDHQLDMLIIIPKKHQLLERIFQKSHSKELVLHAELPMMTIHG